MQHLQSLSVQIASSNTYACNIAARSIKAGNKTALTGSIQSQNNRNRGGCCLGRVGRDALNDDHGHLTTHQIGSQRGRR